MVLKNADSEFSPRISPRNWLLPVLNNQNTPPATPNDGDRYRVTAVATGAWTGQENTIAVWEADASKWRFAALVEPQIWYDMTSQNWHYMSHAGVITQFDKIPLAISDVTGLQAALDGKAPLVHKANHVSGGSDAFVGGDLLDATARLNFLLGGAAVSARRGLNIIAGANISLTFVDNAGAERTDLTINSSAGGNHNLLDGVVDQDTVAASPISQDLIYGNAGGKWDRFPKGGNNTFMKVIAGLLTWSTLVAADIPDISATYVAVTQKAAANGVASLDAGTLVPVAQIPNLTTSKITDILWNRITAVNQGVSSSTFKVTALPAYDEYFITGWLQLDNTAYVTMLINNDSSAKYASSILYGATLGTYVNDTLLRLGFYEVNSINGSTLFFTMHIVANKNSITSIIADSVGSRGVAGTASRNNLNGCYFNGVAVTEIDIVASAGNITAGKFVVYGRNLT